MKRIEDAVKAAKRSNIVPIIFLLVISYFVYYSILEETWLAVGMCMVGFIFMVYLLVMNVRYNKLLDQTLKQISENPDLALESMKNLLLRIDRGNQRFGNSAVNGFMLRGAAKSSVNNKLNQNQLKHNKIAKIVYEITLYTKNLEKKKDTDIVDM